MSEFKKGDRVRAKIGKDCRNCKGKDMTITTIDFRECSFYPITCKVINGREEIFSEDALIKLGGSMLSQYNTLKQQIENLDGDSSLKEWDDVLNEMKLQTWIIIKDDKSSGYGFITVKYSVKSIQTEETFNFTNQCYKLEALQNAYLWLLDHSDIPKVDKKKQEEIEQVKYDIGKLQERLKELEG